MSSSERNESELKAIDLYSSENDDEHGLDIVCPSLRKYFPTVKISVHPSILRAGDEKTAEKIALELASARMKNPDRCEQGHEPMFGEIEYEKRVASGRGRAGGVPYDAFKLGDLLRSLLALNLRLDRISIVFTDRLITTYSRDDLRHHLRTVVCGFPIIISIPGIVEAPARPKEYHRAKHQMELEGGGPLLLEELRRSFSQDFVDYGDDRIADIMVDLSLQGIFYHLTLAPFCSDPECKFYNAHWQRDLIASHFSAKGFCDDHCAKLEELRQKPALTW